MSHSTSSRQYLRTQKPAIIYSREPSTDSRTSDSTTSEKYYSSSRSNMSSSSRSEIHRDPERTHTFRAHDSDNYQGTYKYSNLDRVKVINHNASRVEDPRLHSSRATYENYERNRQRPEKKSHMAHD